MQQSLGNENPTQRREDAESAKDERVTEGTCMFLKNISLRSLRLRAFASDFITL